MVFNVKTSCIPNYEGRAIAFIIVVLKILLGLDGITEYRISRIAENINRYVEKNECLLHILFYVLNLKICKCMININDKSSIYFKQKCMKILHYVTIR